MKKDCVIATHPCGLCNRIDTIATGYLLAKKLEKKLKVLWPITEFHMPISFDALFIGLPKKADLEQTNNYDEKIGKTFQNLILKYLPENYRSQPDYINALRELISYTHPEIIEEVKKYSRKHDLKKAVGLHIRYKEGNAIYPSAQPIHLYVEKMRCFSKNTRFFLSTDEPKINDYLVKKFGERISYRVKKDGDRTTLAGCREGFIDMLLLSNTQSIIGTPYSSFSGVAAMLNNLPIEYINFSFSQNKITLIKSIFFEITLWKKLLYRIVHYPKSLYHKFRNFLI